MLSGVAKSGSPISRWTICLPSASRRRALASTSNALSVPRRDMRSANLIVTFGMLMDPPPHDVGRSPPTAKRLRVGGETRSVHTQERAAVDAERLAGDVPRLFRAEERARRAELGRFAEPSHRRRNRLPLRPPRSVRTRPV